MFDTPVRYSRPLRYFDGGDVFEALDTERASLAWVDFNILEDEIRVTMPEDTDLRIGDVIEVEYSSQAHGGQRASANVSLSSMSAAVAVEQA